MSSGRRAANKSCSCTRYICTVHTKRLTEQKNQDGQSLKIFSKGNYRTDRTCKYIYILDSVENMRYRKVWNILYLEQCAEQTGY
jgi:hypothetical protein